MQIETRRAEGAAAERDGVPTFVDAGSPATGEYHCAACGYGVTVRTMLPACPMCQGLAWEEPSTSPYGGSLL